MGFSYVEFKKTNFVINKALIFVDSEITLKDKRHVIIEELTQSIGLLNDSDKYPNSIFLILIVLKTTNILKLI